MMNSDETVPLLMNSDETGPLLEPAGNRIMERGWCLLRVSNYSSKCKGIGVRKSISSKTFILGGKAWSIHLYPYGIDKSAHEAGKMSLYLKNESAEMVECDYTLHVLDQKYNNHWGVLFDDKLAHRYKQGVVKSVGGGVMHGHPQFMRRALVHSDHYLTSDLSPVYVKYLMGDCLIIRVSVGVFKDVSLAHHSHPFDPYMLFQVRDQLFYSQRSVLRARCPALVEEYHDAVTVIPDIEPRVFQAVLWFIHDHKLSIPHQNAIASSKRSDPNSFAAKMIAAAHRFNLRHLKLNCESLFFYEILLLFESCSAMVSTCKKLWKGGRCRLQDSSQPHIKEA